jgi:hypothetical protein
LLPEAKSLSDNDFKNWNEFVAASKEVATRVHDRQEITRPSQSIGPKDVGKIWYGLKPENFGSGDITPQNIPEHLYRAELLSQEGRPYPVIKNELKKAADKLRNTRTAQRAQWARLIASACFKYGYFGDAEAVVRENLGEEGLQKALYFTEIRCFEIARQFENYELAGRLSPAQGLFLSKEVHHDSNN